MRAALSWDGKGKRIAALALVLAMLSPTAVMAAPKTSSTDTPVTEVIYSSASRGSSWS
jgi:predicted S18 family serine protease